MFLKYIKHLLLILIIGYPLFKSLKYFKKINPIVKELSDFRFTDIYFGHFQEKEPDSDILLIDVGFKENEQTRQEIADFINEVNKVNKPKAVVVDVNFKTDLSVSNEVNKSLINSLENDNVLLYYDLKKVKIGQEEVWLKDKSEIPINYLKVREGYTNCLVEKDTFGVLRFFQPIVIDGNDTLKHLSIEAANLYGNSIKESLIDEKKIMINFSYRYAPSEIINEIKDFEKFKNKIVIIGLFSKNKNGLPFYNDDIHYTSSNKYYLGKSFPNMYGGEVLATIISNIKNDNFIHYKEGLSLYINIILSLAIYYFLLYFKTYYPHTFGTTEIITKFVLAIAFVLLSIIIMHKTNFYIDFTIVGLISFFSVDFIGPISNIIKSIESKLKRT